LYGQKPFGPKHHWKKRGNKMIDLTVNDKILKKNIRFCKEKKIALPTFAMMKDPEKVPASIKEQLKGIGLWDLHSANLFRISWKIEQ
jgi:hypothetical protein